MHGVVPLGEAPRRGRRGVQRVDAEGVLRHPRFVGIRPTSEPEMSGARGRSGDPIQSRRSLSTELGRRLAVTTDPAERGGRRDVPHVPGLCDDHV